MKQISKSKARTLFVAGQRVFMIPCKTKHDPASVHPFKRGVLVGSMTRGFDQSVHDFTKYECCTELGRYPKFYLPEPGECYRVCNGWKLYSEA